MFVHSSMVLLLFILRYISFDVQFQFQDDEAQVSCMTKNSSSNFDMHLILRLNAEGGINGELIYSAAKFGRGTMQRFADEFVHMATAVAEQDLSQMPMLELPMVCPRDLDTITGEWNSSCPCKPFPPPQSVATTLMNAMKGHPSSAIAVEEAGSGISYTYSELSESSSLVASGLQSMPRKNEQLRVALIFNRGFSMYSTLLGVLAAGGVIIPINSSHTPVVRVLFMLEDSEADIIIYDQINEAFASQIEKESRSGSTAELYLYDDVVEMGKGSKVVGVNEGIVSSESVAYILYTR